MYRIAKTAGYRIVPDSTIWYPTGYRIPEPDNVFVVQIRAQPVGEFPPSRVAEYFETLFGNPSSESEYLLYSQDCGTLIALIICVLSLRWTTVTILINASNHKNGVLQDDSAYRFFMLKYFNICFCNKVLNKNKIFLFKKKLKIAL